MIFCRLLVLLLLLFFFLSIFYNIYFFSILILSMNIKFRNIEIFIYILINMINNLTFDILILVT